MPGYLLLDATVTDAAGYEEYKAGAEKVVADFGGRYLVRGGVTAPVEGRWRPRCVLIEFPSYDDTLAFYHSDAYQALTGVRDRCTDSAMILMQGLSDDRPSTRKEIG